MVGAFSVVVGSDGMSSGAEWGFVGRGSSRHRQ